MSNKYEFRSKVNTWANLTPWDVGEAEADVNPFTLDKELAAAWEAVRQADIIGRRAGNDLIALCRKKLELDRNE